MKHVRTFAALAVFAAAATVSVFGCKKDRTEAPGATQKELNREATGAAPDRKRDDDLFLGLPQQPADESSANSTPGEIRVNGAAPEAKGGGPRTDDAPASTATTPKSQKRDAEEKESE